MTANLSADRKKLIERIAKLLALAEGTSYDGEARAARETALRLMAAHNIRASETKEEPFETRVFKPYFSTDVWHERQLKFAIAKLNNCLTLICWLDRKAELVLSWLFVGRPSDLDAYEYMVAIVLRQRTDAWNRYKGQGGPETKGRWLFGYARGVEDKVERLLADLAARMRAQRGNALAPLALIAQAQAWFVAKHGPLGNQPYSNHGGRHSIAGHTAGDRANFYRGEIGTPARRIGPPPKRLSGTERN